MKARILVLLAILPLHGALAKEEAAAAEPLAPKREKLSDEEFYGNTPEGALMTIEKARRGLISDAASIRVDSARHLMNHGKWDDVPYLIDSLADESISHPRDPQLYAGMTSTRYWANVALIAICKTDFGFRWDDPVEKRKEAIGRWSDYWKGLPKQHFGPGMSWLHIDYPANFRMDPRSHQGETKWWAKFDSPDAAVSIAVESFGYISEQEIAEKNYPSAAACFRAEIAPKDSEVKSYPRYHRYLGKTADSVIACYLYDIAETKGWSGKCYFALTFRFKEGEQARHQALIDEVLLSAEPGGKEDEEEEKEKEEK